MERNEYFLQKIKPSPRTEMDGGYLFVVYVLVGERALIDDVLNLEYF